MKTDSYSKINLGCGLQYLHGWVNVDNAKMYPGTITDYNCDVHDFDFRKNCCDRILANHLIMYIRPEKLPILLKRWRSWLIRGGELEIEASDPKYLFSRVDVDRQESLTHLFGKPTTCPHYWIYFTDDLVKMCKDAGFKKVTVAQGILHGHPERDYQVTAFK